MFALAPWRTRPMALLPRTETPFGWMMEEFPAVFNRLFAGFPETELPELLSPRMTMEETEKEMVIRAELPGFEPAEVKVELLGERLSIEAEHKEPEPVEKKAVVVERTYAHVRRVITLPPEVEVEKIEATYRNGVLEIHLPRTPEAVGRRIEVKT